MNKFRLNIDGKEVFGIPGQTILEVARENDIESQLFATMRELRSMVPAVSALWKWKETRSFAKPVRLRLRRI